MASVPTPGSLGDIFQQLLGRIRDVERRVAAIKEFLLTEDIIGSYEIKPNAITPVELADLAVSEPKLATIIHLSSGKEFADRAGGVIDPSWILKGSGESVFASTSLRGINLVQAGASNKIASATAGWAFRGDGTILLPDQSIITQYLHDSAVTTIKIHNDAVTTIKIEDLAVTTPKIDDEAVTTVKIHDLAVTTVKLADDSVTGAKFAVTVTLPSHKSIRSTGYPGDPSWALNGDGTSSLTGSVLTHTTLAGSTSVTGAMTVSFNHPIQFSSTAGIGYVAVNSANPNKLKIVNPDGTLFISNAEELDFLSVGRAAASGGDAAYTFVKPSTTGDDFRLTTTHTAWVTGDTAAKVKAPVVRVDTVGAHTVFAELSNVNEKITLSAATLAVIGNSLLQGNVTLKEGFAIRLIADDDAPTVYGIVHVNPDDPDKLEILNPDGSTFGTPGILDLIFGFGSTEEVEEIDSQDYPVFSEITLDIIEIASTIVSGGSGGHFKIVADGSDVGSPISFGSTVSGITGINAASTIQMVVTDKGTDRVGLLVVVRARRAEA